MELGIKVIHLYTVNMGDPAVDIKAELLQLKDELPAEEKKGNVLKGRIITDNTEIAQCGRSWSVIQAQNNVGEPNTVCQHIEKVERKLGETMEALARNGEKAILKVLEFQKRNCSEPKKAYYYDGFNWPFLY